MIEERDPQLQRAFDERLMRILPPPRGTKKRRSFWRMTGAAAAVLLTASAFAVAADVNRTADAAGESCADILAKVELWFDSVRKGTTEQQMELKRRAAVLIGASCPAKGAPATVDAKVTAPVGSIVDANGDPRCAAAQDEIKLRAHAMANASREELVQMKDWANRLLVESCPAQGGGR